MRNKRKGILMASAILGSAAIVSTGFAAWVITVNESDEAIGQIQVEEVRDETITLKAANLSTPAVKFGAAADTVPNSKGWLKPEGGQEILDVVITVNVEKGADKCKTFEATVSECDANGNALQLEEGQVGPYAAAYAAGYVAALPTPVVSYTTGAETGTVTLNFEWGSYFGDVNPTNFYNQYDYNVVRADAKTLGHTYAQDAASVLASNVFRALNGSYFKVTIAPVRL